MYQGGHARWRSSGEESPRAERGKRIRERAGKARALLPVDRDDDGHETRVSKRTNSSADHKGGKLGTKSGGNIGRGTDRTLGLAFSK